MAKVLYLSYDGMTDPLGQSQVLPYLEGLSKKGHAFHLISFEKPEVFEKNKQAILTRCEEAGIKWHPQPYTKKPPLLSTLKDVRKMKKVAQSLHKEVQFDVVHCRSYLSAIVGLTFKKRFGIKFIFDMRGFWADERVEGKIWDLSNPIFKLVYNYFKRKELTFFNQADHIISLTEAGKKEFLSWDAVKRTEKDVTVIPCCVDTALFDPKAINPHQKRELKAALGIQEGDFVLGYVGSIGTWYMLDEMLAFFSVVLTKKNSAKFLFITGEQPKTIQAKASALNIPLDRIIIASTSHKYVPLHISLFDWSVFFIRPSFSKKASSPTKQGEIMAMGVPLICNSGVGDTDEIVKKYRSGIVLEELTKEAFQKVDFDGVKFDVEGLRAGAIDYFGLENGVEGYELGY